MLITHLFHFTVVFNLSTYAKVKPVLAQSSVKSFITVPVMFSIKSYSPVPQPHFTPTIGSLWFSSISWTSFDADKRRKIIFFHGCIIVNLKITFNFYYVLGAGSVFISWLSLSHWIPLPILANPGYGSHLKDDKTEAQKDEVSCSADKASSW